MLLRTGPSRSVDPTPPRAFTLVELILVMTIVTAVVGLAAPSLASFFRGRALDSEAKRLLALIRHGQSRAVSEGMPMELWVDTEQRTFGLEAESSYRNSDPKALHFALDEDMEIKVVNLDPGRTPKTIAGTASRPASTLGTGASQPVVVSQHAHLPRIRFLPDGSIGETSPQIVGLTDRDGMTLWVTLSRDRVNYEIRTQYTDKDRLAP